MFRSFHSPGSSPSQPSAHSPEPRFSRSFWLSAALALVAGIVLRFSLHWFLFHVDGDPLLYGDLAKNLILHGSYAFSDTGGVLNPTLIRLPGYPLFLAFCFRLFGMENYFNAGCLQIVLDLAGCLFVADLARRLTPPAYSRGAALAALWLAALCPFTSSYAGAALTESPTFVMLALAAWSVLLFRQKPVWPAALLFTFAVTAATLLRPDGALAAVALAPALLFRLPRGAIAPRKLARMALVCVLLALVPFAAWSWRNWRVFHVIQPLAPRLANDPGENPFVGWQLWFKTWSLDFVSTYDIYWNVPEGPFDLSKLPNRAFDSPAQYAETTALAADYKRSGMEITPSLDECFAALARERITAHPLRYYLWLPIGRVADMLLRPRVEDLPIDLDWWVWSHHPAETLFSWAYAVLNALYLVLGFAAIRLRPRLWLSFVAYFAMRCVLLASVAGPEARYTLEFFPFLCAFGGVTLANAAAAIRSRKRAVT